MPTVQISQDLHERLKTLGGQLFTVEEVIERLLKAVSPPPQEGLAAASTVRRFPTNQADLNVLRIRAPRERGVTVEVAGQRLRANTVSGLCEQVIQLLIREGHAEKLNTLLPYSTSNQRYLIARKPKHPNGNDFVAPVSVGPYYVETHKNYETALKQLDQLLRKFDLNLLYIP